MQKMKYDLSYEKAKQAVKCFCSDSFVHYALTHSLIFIVGLCRFLSGDQTIQSVTLLHSDFYGPKNAKKMYLDIVLQDDKGRLYIVEFQNYDIDDENIVRFQLYSMSVLMEQQHKHGYQVEPLQQLIINTGKLIENFEHSYHSVHLMDRNYQEMLKNGLIHMEIIQTRKMKEDIDMNLNDRMKEAGIEQAMRYFYDEEAHNEEPENEVSEELVDLFKEYIDGEHFVDYVQLYLDRSLIEFKMNKKLNEGKAEGRKEGKAEGLEEGIKKGKEEGIAVGKVEGIAEGKAEGIAMERANNLRKRKERISKRMMRKYHVNDLKWLETCDEDQLDKVEDLLDEDISYEEIMRSVLWH